MSVIKDPIKLVDGGTIGTENDPTILTLKDGKAIFKASLQTEDTSLESNLKVYHSMNSIPFIPDYIAGASYIKNKDWSTLDWTASANISTMVGIFDSEITLNITSAVTSSTLTKAISSLNNKELRCIIYCSDPSMLSTAVIQLSSSPYTVQKDFITELVAGNYIYFNTTTSDAGGINSLQFLFTTTGACVIKIRAFYVGTGQCISLLKDESFNGSDAVVYNVSPATGKSLTAAYFNGASSYLELSPFVDANVESFAFFTKCDTTASIQTFFTKEYSLANGYYKIYRPSNSDYLCVDTSNGTTVDTTTFYGFFYENNSVFVHVTLILDFVNFTISVYRNGELFNTISVPYILKPTSTRIRLGLNFVGGDGLTGIIDEFRIFHKELKKYQIYDLIDKLETQTLSPVPSTSPLRDPKGQLHSTGMVLSDEGRNGFRLYYSNTTKSLNIDFIGI